MGKMYAVGDTVHNMPNRNFKLEERILPRTKAKANVVKKTSCFKMFVEVSKLFKYLVLSANRLGLWRKKTGCGQRIKSALNTKPPIRKNDIVEKSIIMPAIVRMGGIKDMLTRRDFIHLS